MECKKLMQEKYQLTRIGLHFASEAGPCIRTVPLRSPTPPFSVQILCYHVEIY